MTSNGRLVVDVTSHNPLRAKFLIEGVARYAVEHTRWRLNLLPVDHPAGVESILRSRADGLICHAAYIPAGVLSGLGRPVVALYRTWHEPGLGVVNHDERAIGRLGYEHLAERGVHTLAFLGLDEPWSREREAGFREAAQERGDPRPVLSLHPPGRPEDRYSRSQLMYEADLLETWLATSTKPLGLMAASDEYAQRAAEVCVQRGIAIPEQVAILGVDNNELRCVYSPITLSSIEPDLDRMGYEAARILDQYLMRGKAPPPPLLIAPKALITRRSTERTLYNDPLLHDAVRFIRDHALEGIFVRDVADALGISRRSLERRFLKYLGVSPDQHIRRIRLEAARQLVLNTNLPFVDILVRCGFSSLSYFSQAFRRAYGCSPRQYRNDWRNGQLPSGPLTPRDHRRLAANPATSASP